MYNVKAHPITLPTASTHRLKWTNKKEINTGGRLGEVDGRRMFVLEALILGLG
jgi:hypothetical protein